MKNVLTVFLSVVLLSTSELSSAQGYPTKPVRMIVPFAPGGTGEFLARSLGPRLGEHLGQQILVDFRPGAGTTLGATLAAQAAPDGYTVLLMPITTLAINHTLYRKLQYDTIKGFAPVTLLAAIPVVLAAHPSFPARTPKELVALAKSHPAKLDFASPGVGTASHFAVELFKLMAKIDLTHIPYKGAGPAIVDTLAGFVPLVTDNVTSLKSHIDAGKLRAVAIGSAQRSAALPQAPTFAESGYPEYEASSWWGILAPSRTPTAIINRVQAETVKTLTAPDVRERLVSHGTTVVAGSADSCAKQLAVEIDKWARVVKATGAKVE